MPGQGSELHRIKEFELNSDIVNKGDIKLHNKLQLGEASPAFEEKIFTIADLARKQNRDPQRTDSRENVYKGLSKRPSGRYSCNN
jgi:hypothetical protein